MKKTAFGFVAAIALGLAAFSAPASAFQAPVAGLATATDHGVTTVQYRRHRSFCTVRTVVTRGKYGRTIVRKVRVCR